MYNEMVMQLGIKREPGYLYFVRGSDVFKTPMKRFGLEVKGQVEKVATGNFERQKGYLYFLDRDGNVSRVLKCVGGQVGARR